jgi:hypothetical protein
MGDVGATNGEGMAPGCGGGGAFDVCVGAEGTVAVGNRFEDCAAPVGAGPGAAPGRAGG